MPGATGSTSGAAIDAIGLKEFRRQLREIDRELTKELRVINKKVADEAAAKAKDIASGMGGVQARAASAIRGKANQRDARIGVLATGRNAMANVAFWGAKRRTGWYSAGRYASSSTPQHPEWVGNSWDVGAAGQGPYAINEAINRNLDALLDIFRDGIEDLARRAFND